MHVFIGYILGPVLVSVDWEILSTNVQLWKWKKKKEILNTNSGIDGRIWWIVELIRTLNFKSIRFDCEMHRGETDIAQKWFLIMNQKVSLQYAVIISDIHVPHRWFHLNRNLPSTISIMGNITSNSSPFWLWTNLNKVKHVPKGNESSLWSLDSTLTICK